MSILLGIRIAFAGGRESVARMSLMAGGVAVGMVLLLFCLTAMPALQGRIDRYAWHRTDASSPATAPDPALLVAITDRYAGQNLIRVHIAALGAHPPVPPGVDRLPGPGEVFVSPALAEELRTAPDDQLRDRFPGRVTGTIGPDGLISPVELVAIVGRTPAEMRDTPGAYEIRGFEQPGEPLDLRGPLGVLDPGVVAIRVEGAPEARLAPLLTEGVVVARSGPGRSLVVSCVDLARVTDLTCPLPTTVDNEPVRALFDPTGFAEPGPEAGNLPIHLLLVPTDGSPAAEERVRTLAAITAPHARNRTLRDYTPGGSAQPLDAELADSAFAALGVAFWLAMMFVVLVGACSLTVSVVSGLMERRRPFALLRASGVRLGELRRIVLLETGVPLVGTVLGGMGTALLVGYAIAPDEFDLPGPGFFLGVGAAVLVAFAVSTVALPLMDVATRHDSVRFE